MSPTSTPPRARAIKVGVIEALRADDTLAGWLYADGAIPPPTDRDRIHEHDAGRESLFEDMPAHIAVAATLGGSSWRGGGTLTRTYLVQCTITVTDDWYERHTGLELSTIRDRCDDVLVHAPLDGVYPAGPESANPHEIRTGASRRTAIGRWRFKTHGMTYSR